MCPTRFKAFLTLISDHAHSRWRGDKLPSNSMENLFPGTLLWSLVFIRNDFPVVFLQIACEQILERLKPYQMENPKGSWEEWVSTLFFLFKEALNGFSFEKTWSPFWTFQGAKTVTVWERLNRSCRKLLRLSGRSGRPLFTRLFSACYERTAVAREEKGCGEFVNQPINWQVGPSDSRSVKQSAVGK